MAENKAAPLECFKKGKELREQLFHEVVTAREDGKLVISGSVGMPISLVAGFGDFAFIGGDTYASNVSSNPEMAIKAAEAVERMGYARDMCGYFRADMGSVLLNFYLFGGEYPRPDFCFSSHDCESRSRWTQAVAEHFDAPLFVLDVPMTPLGERKEDRLRYMTSQLYDIIAQIEKVTGREFNDEKFIQALHNEYETKKLWAEIFTLNAAIPAPLNLRAQISFMALVWMRPDDKRVIDFLKILKDEVKYRIDKGIGIIPGEKGRLMLDGSPPYYGFDVFKYIEEAYRVVWVGSYFYAWAIGLYGTDKDGGLIPGKTLKERGTPLANRDDAIRALLEISETDDGICIGGVNNSWETIGDTLLKFVKLWKVDGFVFEFNRSCPGAMMGTRETQLILQEAGVPVTSFEASNTDPREFDSKDIMHSLDRFMEILGFKKEKS